MEIFVGCGSSNKIDKKYLKSAYELGTIIGKNGHTLIFGSSDEGMMGELYRGAKENNCNIISVYPKDYKGFLKEVECKKTITVETTSEQLIKLVKLGDATIIMPGSFGTLTELMASIFWKKVKEHQKPVIILNIDGFFDDFINLVDKIYSQNFDFFTKEKLYSVVNTPLEAITLLENL